MTLFLSSAQRLPRRHHIHTQDGGSCPQPACCHPSHNGVPVPQRYHGTSRLQGMVVHHVRCVINPAHHVQFLRVGNRWVKLAT
jgi:hypothetical protein